MYDFKQLSPADFEELTRDLLQKEWRVRLESFKSGRDGGIDLRYSAVPDKQIIIQCKRYVDTPVSKLISNLRDTERAKVERLSPDRYVLATTLPLNPQHKEKIIQALAPFIHSSDDVFGADDLNNLLALHPEVETAHYKLWLSSSAVLERVLLNAEKVQTDFDVERIRRAIPLYVQNSSYSDAMKKLDEHRFVIISGVPGIGKTTLADMLLFAHLEKEYQPVVISSDIAEGRRQFKVGTKQIFYFDDFLGQTFLGNRFDFLGRKEDKAILDFLDLVAHSKTAKMVLTTREHILQSAIQMSERFQRQRSELAFSKCVLEMRGYTLLDRARILYNHIFFSELPPAYRDALLRDNFYLRVLKHQNFNPRLIEWLSRYSNVRNVPPSQYQGEVTRILDHPEQLWRVAFEQQISESSRSLLLALYTLGGEANLQRLESIWKAVRQHRAEKYNLTSSADDWVRSLRELEGGFLRYEHGQAAFVNPSVKDFFDMLLSEDSEYLDDLISAARSFEQIVKLWALARSDKGEAVRSRLARSPEKLMETVNRHISRPYEERLEFEGGGYGIRRVDVRPEIRLGTIISIANRTESMDAIETAANYTNDVLEFWKSQWPEYGAAVALLATLDRVDWKPLLDLDLHSRLKAGVLATLGGRVGSYDLEQVIGYADRQHAQWTDADQAVVKNAFERYLQYEFDDELSNCSDLSDVEGLADSLQMIACRCEVDVDEYLDRTSERASELGEPDYDDDEPRREWRPNSTPTSEAAQEMEVTRLFDGLKTT